MPRAALLRGRKPWVTPARALVEQYGITVLPHPPHDPSLGGSSGWEGICLRFPVTSADSFITLVHEVAHQVLEHHHISLLPETQPWIEAEAWTWTCEWIEEHAAELPPSAVRVVTQEARVSMYGEVWRAREKGVTEFPALADTPWDDLPALVEHVRTMKAQQS